MCSVWVLAVRIIWHTLRHSWVIFLERQLPHRPGGPEVLWLVSWLPSNHCKLLWGISICDLMSAKYEPKSHFRIKSRLLSFVYQIVDIKKHLEHNKTLSRCCMWLPDNQPPNHHTCTTSLPGYGVVLSFPACLWAERWSVRSASLSVDWTYITKRRISHYVGIFVVRFLFLICFSLIEAWWFCCNS